MEKTINNNNYLCSSEDDNYEKRAIYSKNDNIEIMISNEADKKLFDS